jgi:flagellar biosynthesis/type III secretory pathway protein FliH
MSEAADALIEDAERNARVLTDEAAREVAAMIEAAREEGAQEGAAQAEHMREEIAGLQERMLKEVEGEVVRTAMRVAHELLAAELALREDAVVDVAAAALQAAKTARDINLRTSPRDAAILRAHKPRLVSVLTRAKDLEIREDKRVKPGGVLIETEAGVVDAQLETQLEELERVLDKPAFGEEKG